MSSAPAADVPASSDPAPALSEKAAQKDPAPAPAQAEATEAAAPAAVPLAADEDVAADEEEDPTLSETASSTASLNSSIMKYRTENGRTYHSYKDGKYVLPNDEAENNRLDLQHELCILTFDGKLYNCPAGQNKPLQRVLDAGTGTGIWAMDFGLGDENPQASVIGVDLSPIQPTFVPPNVSFVVDDLEEPWTYSSKFDFIHARMLTGSIADFPKLFKSSFDHLAPGGWIELADTVFPLASDDDSVPADSPLARWAQLVLEGSQKIGRPLNSALHYEEQLRAAGFVNVTVQKFKWPTNAWPRDARMKEVGTWTYHDLCGGLQGLSMALFTRVLGWSTEELELFLVGVRKDFKNRNLHGYFPVWVTYAQKPEV